MKIIVKTIKGETFPIEVEPSDNIGKVKDKIKEVKGFEVDTQKIILKGQSTNDQQTINDLGVKEGDFFVVMVTKKAPAPAPQAPAQSMPAPPPVQQPAQPAPVAQPQQQGGGGSLFGAQDIVTGEQANKVLDDIVAMGFPRDQAQKALRAAFNNADRAIEYLFNGIPEHLLAPQAPPQPQGQPRPAGQQPPQPAGGFGGPTGQEAEDLLNAGPEVEQLRNLAQTNPEAFQNMLQQLAAVDPQFGSLMAQNPEAVQQFLLGGGGAGGHGGMGGGGARPRPPPGSIQVTPAEKAQIDRLCGLGFDKQLVLEAWLACDKDENLAANYLFDRVSEMANQPPAGPGQGQQGGGGGQGQGHPGGGQGGNNPPPHPPGDDDNIFH